MFFLPIGDVNERERVPYVNWALIIVNVFIFFVSIFSLPDYGDFVKTWGFIAGKPSIITAFSSCFLHAGILHLAGNMLFLWIFGDNLEDRLGHIGYLLFYLVAAIASVYFHGAVCPAHENIPCIGASGAISAVMGGYLVLFPRNRIIYWYFAIYRFGTFRLAAGWAIGFWFAMQFVDHLSTQNPGMFSNIAYGAHIGGFIMGAVIAGVLLISGIIHGKWDRVEGQPAWW